MMPMPCSDDEYCCNHAYADDDRIVVFDDGDADFAAQVVYCLCTNEEHEHKDGTKEDRRR